MNTATASAKTAAAATREKIASTAERSIVSTRCLNREKVAIVQTTFATVQPRIDPLAMRVLLMLGKFKSELQLHTKVIDALDL